MISSTFNFPAIRSELHTSGENSYRMVISPLLPGFGPTIGNSLRRIMLSSLPGFAVTKVRINDITHEYQAVDGVKEDALDVLLNLRMLRVRIVTDAETETLVIKSKKGGVITAASFDKNGAVDIVNKDLYVCTLAPGHELHIEVEISRGFGYVSYEKRDLRGNTDPVGMLVDASFSPVKNVALDIEKVRVGDQTNFDAINISFDTDGTVTGEEIAQYTIHLCVDLFQKIESSFGAAVDGAAAIEQSQTSAALPATEDLSELGARTVKVLEKNGITSVKELMAKKGEISEFPGLGDKTLKAIQAFIAERE